MLLLFVDVVFVEREGVVERERHTNTDSPGVMGRGYALTWQEREREREGVVAVEPQKALFHSNHATWHHEEEESLFPCSP